jgi:hypothetical protein
MTKLPSGAARASIAVRSTQGIHRPIVNIVGALLALAHCGGSAIVESSSSGPDASGSGFGGDAACPAAAEAGPRATTVSRSRPVAYDCPSAANCPVDNAEAGACSTAADCFVDGGPTRYCVRGRCSADQCLADSDCPSTQVCGCSPNNRNAFGVAFCNPNQCLPANCHVDGDCGPDGFCSPDVGGCGAVFGYYCHRLSDVCFDPVVDCACASVPEACVWAPTVGAWTCGSTVCSG